MATNTLLIKARHQLRAFLVFNSFKIKTKFPLTIKTLSVEVITAKT
jgi:hypothetical protein